MSPVTWGRVEKGELARSLTYAGIERALSWRAGSIETVIRGEGDPVVEERVSVHDHVTATDNVTVHVMKADEAVEGLIREIYADPDMPDERKHEHVRLIRKAEAQRQAEIRAAQDELNAWRTRRATG